MFSRNSSVSRAWRSVGRAAAVALLATVASAGVAHAQEAATRKPFKTLVTVNPLGLPFEYLSMEFENKLTNLATLGTSLSWLSPDNVTYLSIEEKIRFYPNEEAFKGFSIGLAGGITHLSEDNATDGTNNSATRPTIAVIADYNWILGKAKRVIVGTGVGAKRIFGSESGFFDTNFAYPTARFQVGVTF